MRKGRIVGAMLGIVVLLSGVVQAVTINWVGGANSNDWNDVASWSSAYVPGSITNDTALFVGTADNTTLVTPFTFTNSSSINLRSNGGPTVTLNADLSGISTLYLGGNSGHDGGTISHFGGTLSAASLRVGSSAGATTESAYTILGGRIANSGHLYVNKGTFTLSGSSAEVEADSMTVTGIGTLAFSLGSEGVTPISVTNAFAINDSTSKLTIDASAYTGTNSVIELLQFGSLSGSFAASEVTVIGLSADQEPASIVYDNNRMTLELATPDPNWAAFSALGDLTNAPAIYDIYGTSTTWSAVATAATGAVQAIYYDGLDYLGNPTRVFAYVKLPADASVANQVPGVVLVHGGGGTAIPAWVEKWADRGYAAIAMDNEGDAFDPDGVHIDSPYPGPHRTGIYADSEPENVLPLDEQWEYHATATVILANSLLRAMPEVDAEKVGVTGVSWGGVLTSTAIGLDDRFAFAIPVYGCGRLFDLGNQYGAALGDNFFYQTILDPILRMDRATMPQLWCSWPGEDNFSLDSQAATYLAGTNGEHSVALVPGMGHGHAASYLRPEPYDFADHVLATGTLWGKQQSLSRVGDAIEVVFASTKPLYNATLIYTTGTGYTGDLDWPEIAADSLVDNLDGTWTVQATLPTNATAWFVNVNALGSDVADLYDYKDTNLYMSSDYQEVIQVTLNPETGFEMSHPVTVNQSTGTIQVDCTVPTNLEIVEIRAANETHPGSLTYQGEYPVVLDDTGLLDLEFDNTVAGLALNETATGMAQVVWEHMDGSTEMAELPFTVTARTTQTVIYDITTNWSSKTVYEIDDVFVRSNATVSLDQASVAGTLTISEGELTMDENVTLLLADTLAVEASGSLSVFDGELDFNGGAFVVDGSVTIDGGSMSVETLALSGAGSLLLKSGALNINSGTTLDINLLEVSGGSIDFGSSSTYVGDNGSTELRVVGDEASISMTILNLQPHTVDDPTLRFVLNETGVSTIQVSSYMNLPMATIIVDGSAYTGGATNIVLIDSTNLATPGDTNKFSTIGFAENGLSAVVVQDQGAGADWVQLIVTKLPKEMHLIGQDDFDGTADYASRSIVGEDNGALRCWSIVDRSTVGSSYILDTSLFAQDGSAGDGTDAVGFLKSTDTDAFFGMVRSLSADAALTYTFDVTGYEDLSLSMDWISGEALASASPVYVAAWIDDGATNEIFRASNSSADWTLTMENGTSVVWTSSAEAVVNGTSAGTITDVWSNFTCAVSGEGSVLTVKVYQPSKYQSTLGMDNLQLSGAIVPGGFADWISSYDLSGSDTASTANPDGDAYTNGEEFIAGLNPEVFDTFEVQSISAGSLEWDAVTGRVYSVYWSSNLVDGFTRVGSNLVDGIYLDEEAASEPQGFYKIIIEMAP